MVRVAAVAVAIVLSLLLPSTNAFGASACATAVLRDWSEDGRVAPKYSPPCYQEAIDALPTDLRDYTDAEDVITRALSNAVRTSVPAQAIGHQGDRSVPLALAGLVALALVILGGGGVAYIAHRHRSAGDVLD